MNLVVDTSVWSLVLRRPAVDEAEPHVRAFRLCVARGDEICLLGPILQELLDLLKSPQQSQRLLKLLQPFPLLPLERNTYVLAAELRNDCRRRGIQAGPTDFLIAAACIEARCPLLTADKDFERIATATRLTLVLAVPPQ